MNTLIDDTLPRQTLCNIRDTLALLQAVTLDDLPQRGQMGYFIILGLVSDAVAHIENNFKLEAQQ